MGKQKPNTAPQGATSTGPIINPPDPRNNLPFAPNMLGFGPGFAANAQPSSDVSADLLIKGYSSQGDPLDPGLGLNNSSGLVYHGMISENTQDLGFNRPGGPFALHFMFNPTDVSYSYSFDQTTLPVWARTPDQQGRALANNRVMNLSELVFDRTYEVWWGDPPGSSPGPGTFGALWDARAAERLVGMLDGPLQQPPRQSLVDVQLSNGSGQPMSFTGLITGLDIHFTRFDNHMIPIRCGITMSITEVLKDQTSSSTTTPTTDPTNAGTTGAPAGAANANVADQSIAQGGVGFSVPSPPARVS